MTTLITAAAENYTLVVECCMVGGVLNIYVKISFFLDLNKTVDRMKINCRRLLLNEGHRSVLRKKKKRSL